MRNLIEYIRNVPDWPKKGIQFKDVTTLAKDPEAFKESCDQIIEKYKNKGIDKVAAIEARGYVWGGVIAYQLNAGFILIRKPSKLPANTISETYQLEYGTDTIEMHEDAVEKGDNVFLWDFCILETEGGIYLKNDNAASESDSHPNSDFSKKVAPYFCQRIIDVIEGNGDNTKITGENN